MKKYIFLFLILYYPIVFSAQIITEEDGFQWNKYLEDGYNGAKDSKGKIIIPPFYNNIKYIDGCFLTESDAFGQELFSYKGKNMTSKFKDNLLITKIDGADGLFKVITGKLTNAVIDNTGKTIISEENNYFYVDLDGDKQNGFYFKCSNGEYMGIHDISGKTVIPANKYTFIRRVGNKAKGIYYIYNIFDKEIVSGVCNEDGKEIIRTPYRNLIYKDTNSKIFFSIEHGNSTGEMDLKGNIIRSPKPFDKSVPLFFGKKYNEIRSKNGYYGVSDLNGNIIIPPEYDMIIECKKGFIVRKGKFKGLYNINGDCIIRPDRFYQVGVGDDNYIWGKDNTTYSLFDDKGKKIINENTSTVGIIKVDNYTAYMAKSADNCKWAIFNANGERLTPYIYDSYYSFKMKDVGVFHKIAIKGKYGICDSNGKEIIPPYYTNIGFASISNNIYFTVYDGENMGVYSIKGNLIIPSDHFTSIEFLSSKIKASNGEWKCEFSFDGKLLSDNKENLERDKYIGQADIEFNNKNYRKSASLYKKAIEIRPSASLYFNVGVSYYNNKKYNDAIDYFKMCLDNKPSKNLIDRSKNLIIKARNLQAEKIERRQQLAANIFGLVLGAATVYAQTKIASSGSNNRLSTQRNSNFDYLLDPAYTVRQVQIENWSEYIRDTNGGKTMSYDEWYANIKAPAIRAASGDGGLDTSSSSSSSNSSSSSKSSSGRECPQCHGTGRMEYNTNPAQYGSNNAYKVKCNECGKEVLKSWGHTHITCKICHGHGTI